MAKPNILFVDDEIRVVRSLKMLFASKSKFEVYTATSGAEALSMIKEMPIHVVVSDQRMPVITGVNLLHEIKKISPNTIGMLLTGYADLDAIVASINEGEVYRYITKPWQNQELLEKVSGAMDIAMRLFAADTMPTISKPVNENDEKQGILVLHPKFDDSAALLVNKLFGDGYSIYSANNINIAIELLQKEDISVVVTDIGKNDYNCATLIKSLKKAYPLVLSVVVTDGADANVAISLINQGQVYRYLPKPIQTGRLKLSISSALGYHNKCKINPVQLVRHQVDAITAREEIDFDKTFKSRLSMLKNLFMARV
ncbi:MAG TPA: response regulator [Gammaproteobacteria bacterium]